MEIKKIKLKNFFSFKNLAFEFSDGLSLFEGKNGVGKTSIFEAIFWCLSGDTVRGCRAADVITFGEKECEVSLEFIYKEMDITIKRYYSKNTKLVEFFSVLNGELKEKKFHDTKEATEFIFNFLGIEKDVFSIISFFGNNFLNFTGLKPRDKYEIFKMLSGVGAFEFGLDNVKKEIKDEKENLKNFENEKNYLEKEITSKNDDISFQEGLLREESLKKQNELVDLKTKKDFLKVDFEKIVLEIQSLKKPAEKQKVDLTYLENSLKNLSIEKTDKEKSILQKENALEIEIMGLKNTAKNKEEIDKLKFEISSLEENLKNFKCVACGRAFENFNSADFEGQITFKKGLLLDFEKVRENFIFNSIKDVKLKMSKEIDGLKKLVVSLWEEMVLVDSQITVLKEEKAIFEKVQNVYYEKLDALKEKKSYFFNSISNIDLKITAIEGGGFKEIFLVNIKNINEKKALLEKQVIEKIKAFDESSLTMEQFVFLEDSFKKIIFNKFEGLCSLFEKSVENFLTGSGINFSGVLLERFKEISTGKINPSIDLFILREGIKISVASLSAGERQRVNLACFFTIFNIVENSKNTFFKFKVLDEPLDGLDSEGKEAIFGFLKDMGKEKQIFVAEHSSDFKNLFNNSVMIKKNEGGSYVEK